MWKAFAEQFKECGRHTGGLFLLGLLGAPVCAAMVSLLGAWTANLLWITWAILIAPVASRGRLAVRSRIHPAIIGIWSALTGLPANRAATGAAICRAAPDAAIGG